MSEGEAEVTIFESALALSFFSPSWIGHGGGGGGGGGMELNSECEPWPGIGAWNLPGERSLWRIENNQQPQCTNNAKP